MSQEPTNAPQSGQEPGQGQEPAPQVDGGQEPKVYDEAYVKKLRDEAAAYRVSAQKAEAKVQEFEDKDKSELQRLQEQIAESQKNESAATLLALRYEVAAKKDIPLSQAHRLQGSTLEELEADADSFLGELGTSKSPSFDGGVRQASKAPTMDDAIRGMLGVKT